MEARASSDLSFIGINRNYSAILATLHMKALSELRFIKNVLRSTLSYPNETSKECIQFLKDLSQLRFTGM
jgi:hypothetical protein